MRTRNLIIMLVFGVAIVTTVASGTFSGFVYNSLWDKSVTDILEITTQGRNALDTFFEKDLDTLDLLVGELSEQDSDDLERIEEKIALFNDKGDASVYLLVNLSTGEVSREGAGRRAVAITPEQLELIASQPQRGILKPFLDERTGVNMIGAYEKFAFADGTQGLVRKTRPLQEVADKYSISFYDESGFSYVVDEEGSIVIRSTNRNSNRTIANIYELVEHEGNDEATIASFREALENGKRGVALFSYMDEEYVFCYTQVQNAEGWDFVSIIPNSVIMEQAYAVLQATLALCVLIALLLAVILLTYWRSSTAQRRQIEHMAYYDKLTGLFSEDKFEIEGERMMQAARDRSGQGGVAVAYFNIADFKLINDMDGYQRGDDVLQDVAAIIEDASRTGGIASRQTADHFLMMFPYRTKDEAVQRCDAVVRRCRSIVAAGKPIAMRVGLCCSEEAPDAKTPHELTDRARIAKTRGRASNEDVCLFNASMREDMLRRAELESSMEAALEAGEFFPLVQPKFNVDGTRVLGGEALVRWNRPGEGIVSPAEFIPLFEQNGFIVKLDQHMFERVCQVQRKRLDAGLPVVPVSVNASRLHLHNPSFVPTYVRIKDAYGIPDDLCELELTESMVLEDLDNAVSVIDQLRAAGFRCSIDDFGSGQSSLNALKELPADELKLDRAFLFERDHSEKEEVIVRTVIDMAGKLDMKTVMEGVETQDQLSFIKTTSCDMIQGFVFSRPVPLQEFEQLLDEG